MKSIALRQWEAAAYAAGRLTQLRRVVTPQPYFGKPVFIKGTTESFFWGNYEFSVPETMAKYHCPYGAPGDRLALREGARMPLSAVRWHPVITAVRLERVQEMTGGDARACGCDGNCAVGYIPAHQENPCVYHYAQQFTRDNPRTPWDSNPWVWVIDVEGVKA